MFWAISYSYVKTTLTFFFDLRLDACLCPYGVSVLMIFAFCGISVFGIFSFGGVFVFDFFDFFDFFEVDDSADTFLFRALFCGFSIYFSATSSSFNNADAG